MNPTDLHEDTQQFPPNWKPDPTLRDLIGPEHDWRLFRRIAAAPDRFAVNISGTWPYIWNLQKKRPVEPMSEGSKGTRLVVNSDPNPFIDTPIRVPRSKSKTRRIRMKLHLGKLKGERTFVLARLIAEAVYGPPPHSKSEAHHVETYPDRFDDHWSNLSWCPPGQNRAIELVRHPLPRQQSGQWNSNAKISNDALRRIIFLADCRSHTADKLAKRFNVTPAYLRALLREDARADEVRAIRAENARFTT